MRRAPGAIGAIPVLRHDPLDAEVASVFEHNGGLLFLQRRTSDSTACMSASGHKRTPAVQQIPTGGRSKSRERWRHPGAIAAYANGAHRCVTDQEQGCFAN